MNGRTAALVLRGAAILIVALSPLLPDAASESDARSVVYVVDESFSVADSRDLANAYLEAASVHARGLGVDMGVVRVADQVRLVRAVGAPAKALAIPPVAPGTELAEGIRVGRFALPQHGTRRLVLLTDGRSTRGDVRQEVQRARDEGIVVDVVALGTPAAGDSTRLGNLEALSSRATAGESVELTAEVFGPAGIEAVVEAYRDGTPFARDSAYFDLDGKAVVRFVDREPSSGMHVYEAQLVVAGDTPIDRTRRRAAVLVSGKPKVLVVTLLGDQPTLLVDAIRQADAEVEHLQLTEGRLTEERLSGVDLVVLSDLPLERAGEVSLVSGLSVDAQHALVDYVSEQGGGLVATGGAFGFGPEYASSPLARILPIRIEDQGEVDDPPIAMVVSLDRSGSMGARVGTHTKMELAVEASLAAAATLRGTDRIAIASVDVASDWAQPLAPASELPARRNRVRRIRAGGGGIYVYTALADAYRQLQDATEPIRHVILFSDTADSEEQWLGCPFRPCSRRLPYAVDFARDARRTGITTSVVGIGAARDPDTGFLQDLAAAGGGRFYLTTRGSDLRRIFVTETRAAALSNLREEPTSVRRAAPSPMIDGLGDLPDVEGFVQSETRSTADTALVTGEGKPVLASWRYGLGTVVALTTDAGGRWTERWNEWAGAGQLMRQIVRFAQRRRAPQQADVRVELNGTEVEVQIDAPLSGAPPAQVELFAHGVGDAVRLEPTLERIAPGRYVARATAPVGITGGGPPVVLTRVRDAEGTLVGEAVQEQSAAGEFAARGPDETALNSYVALGGGQRDPTAEETLRAAGSSTPKPVPTWPWALLVAATLVVIDLWLRRFERARRVAVSVVPVREVDEVRVSEAA